MIKKVNIEQLIMENKMLDGLKQQLKAKKEEFDEQNHVLLEGIKLRNEEIESLKDEIRLDAMAEFKQTDNKKLLGGIGIRVGQVLEYDKDVAFKWAKEHQLCLSLNDTEFKKIAKTQDLEFVKSEEKVTVTFPKEIKLD